MKNKGYARFWGANKVHYGRCAGGVYFLLPSSRASRTFRASRKCCVHLLAHKVPVVQAKCLNLLYYTNGLDDAWVGCNAVNARALSNSLPFSYRNHRSLAKFFWTQHCCLVSLILLNTTWGLSFVY